MVSENMVVEAERVIVRHGGKGMMGSMQMDKQKELRQQPQQHPQLPGAAALDPWPPPMQADLNEINSEREIKK